MENKQPRMGFRGGPGGMMAMGKGEKPKNLKKAVRTFLRYLRPHMAPFLIVMALAALGTIFSVISPKILGTMTDTIAKGIIGHKGIDFGNIAQTGKWLIGIYLASSAFTYLQNWIMAAVSQKIVYKMRKDFIEKISRLPLGYYDQHEKGNIISRATNDIEMIGQNLNQGLSQMLSATITVIGMLAMMASISWEMTIIAVLILPASFLFSGLIIKKSQKYFGDQQESLGKIYGHIEEMFANHVVVKSFNGEKVSLTHFNKINHDLYEGAWKSQFITGLMMPITMIISNLGYVAAAVTGGILATSQRISIGNIQAFIQYMNQFTQPINQLANITNVFQTTAAAAERLFEFLEEKEEAIETSTLPALETATGRVDFEQVSFGYQKDKQVITNFTAHIKPHSNVAIVGPTGAGKTTLVNLLMRFYEADSGKILIDGTDIAQMKRKDVRKLFGMVLQDTWLFSGTVAENIAFGKQDATRDEIVAAAKEAHVDHFIRTLPNGYDTVIGDSIDNISAGEKQLLTIARAVLADAPMLILDEATSSVDTRTEKLIQAAMKKMTAKRTSFVIAHRLSTIKNADVILVIKNGNIVEQGTHSELIKKKGFYAEIYESQFSD